MLHENEAPTFQRVLLLATIRVIRNLQRLGDAALEHGSSLQETKMARTTTNVSKRHGVFPIYLFDGNVHDAMN